MKTQANCVLPARFWQDKILMTAEGPPSEQKERIYRVAARLFSESGYRSTSMRDIAAAMNIKAGSLYAHITGKEEVLWEIIVRIADEFDEAVQPFAARQGPAADRLRGALEAYVNVVSRNLDMAAVLFTEWRQLPQERQDSVAGRRDRVEGVFRELLGQGVRAGEFAPELNIKLTAILALSGANWLPNWYRPGGSLSPQDVADGFVALLLRGIEPRAAEPDSG